MQNEIITETKRSIFIIYGNRKKMYEMWNFFKKENSSLISDKMIVTRREIRTTKYKAYELADADFLMIKNFRRFYSLKSSSLKEIVAGEKFQFMQIWFDDPVFIQNFKPKKILIFAGKERPTISILETEKALEARMKFIEVK